MTYRKGSNDSYRGPDNQLKVQTRKKKYPVGKQRPILKPYATWTDPRTGWKYSLLKSWQQDNSQHHARWFMAVRGWGDDMGDTYVKDLLPGLVMAAAMQNNLTFDTAIWADTAEFIAWAKGEKQ